MSNSGSIFDQADSEVGAMAALKFFRLGEKTRKILFLFVLVVFLSLNALSYLGAYVLTHYSSAGHWGLGIPKSTSSTIPSDIGLEYVTQRIPINQTEWLETWFIPTQMPVSSGTVLLFPGNAGSKAIQLLAPAKVFHHLGYDTLLIDFRGLGGSSGNTTTLGVREAKDVALALTHAQRLNFQRPFILYGVSMGSAAILKAVADETVHPDAVILELPFARLLDAVRSRLRENWIPSFPIAEMIVFWGSVQHGINGFTHNPVNYAKQVQCPALLLHGKLDKWITLAEIDRIFQNLQGSKKLTIFPNADHSLLVTVDKELWQRSVEQFLKRV
ncbi:alpha/beta hydrolase [Pseudanabaena sp. 'Roaring Creek']|uniref:alpha/beta hydrolase n=1 Tax=Pseudanabaena sp. 'Roaring Creek' TaxID=1681830 RepID=UPI001E5D8C9E|nr:alpha/beta fold hydrolase [Pseudanabaena sp. 'Roaring Creek']